MSAERLFEVRLVFRDPTVLRDFPVDNECLPIRTRSDGMIEMEAIVPESALSRMKAMPGREVEVAAARPASDCLEPLPELVSPINRYADGSLPRGPGRRHG